LNGLFFGLVGLTLLASALLSAAESATFSVGPSRLRTLREEGFKGSEILQAVRDEGPSIRAATFLVNSLLNGISVGLLVAAATLEWGAPGAMVALPLGLLGILVLAEGLPRLVASRRSIRLALLSAPSLRTLEVLVRPLLTPFLGLESLFQRKNGDGPGSIEEREVRELAELGRREGVVEEDEHALVERAFRMDELAAWDVMTPRVDIFAWKDSLTLEEVIPQLRNVPFSRVPVYGQSVDDITGILYVREAYAAYVAGKRELLLSELSRDPLFVPGSLPLPRLLRDFQARRIHMGIVADEFGGTDGLVTLEDVIEELVGEIEDETDILEESFVRISRSELEVEGGIELREVNYVFNVSLPHLDHRSLNGFILEELGRVPEAGETLEIPGLQIEILDATETQVVRALLRKTHAAAAEEIEGAGGTA
jgi:putative hemolysin